MGFYVEYDPKRNKPSNRKVPSASEERLGAIINLGYWLAGLAAFIWLGVMIVRAAW
jgi:hypothetical protein